MSLFNTQIAGAKGVDYATTDLQVLDYWLLASRDNNMLRVNGSSLETSTNLGNTWSNSIEFDDIDLITQAIIFNNGNISIFTSNNKIYITNLQLDSVEEVTVTENDGVTAFYPHTPVDEDYPGAYYTSESHMSYNDVEHVYCLANYCNSSAIRGGVGVSAVIIPITFDKGLSWKVSYMFGQNLNYGDNGTATGSSAGTLLGDSENSTVCRHVHNIEYNPYNRKYYCNTGDTIWTYTTPDMFENNWLEGEWNEETQTIDWSVLNFGENIERTSRLKSTAIWFYQDYIYWGSDANPTTVDDEQGIFRAKIDSFTDLSTHEKVYGLDANVVVINAKVDPNTNRVLAIIKDEDTGDINTLLAINDLGHGDSDTYVVPNNPILLKLNSPDSDGYFRMDFDGFDLEQSKSIRLKVGEDLFDNL